MIGSSLEQLYKFFNNNDKSETQISSTKIDDYDNEMMKEYIYYLENRY